jgi:hypothetical protein
MFQVRGSRILSFEGSVTEATKDPSLRSGQDLNIELLNIELWTSALPRLFFVKLLDKSALIQFFDDA